MAAAKKPTVKKQPAPKAASKKAATEKAATEKAAAVEASAEDAAADGRVWQSQPRREAAETFLLVPVAGVAALWFNEPGARARRVTPGDDWFASKLRELRRSTHGAKLTADMVRVASMQPFADWSAELDIVAGVAGT